MPSRWLLFLLVLAGCRGGSASRFPFSSQFPSKLDRDLAGLHNLIRVSPTIYSGGEPHDEEAFASLQKLGIKTIISVDGAKPEVERAKKFGIRYIHIPFGYDGIPEESRLQLVAVAREITSPVYVHCHHGKHRGPAGAAILCLANGKTDPAQGKKILELAGTSRDYPGLWRDVEAFRPPEEGAKLPTLVEVAEVDSLALAMASIDRHWDDLKLCESTGWKTPADHPDLDPVREALLLKEGFHESLRELKEGQPAQLKQQLAEAEAIAGAIETDLRAGRTESLGASLKQLDQACKGCHQKYRN